MFPSQCSVTKSDPAEVKPMVSAQQEVQKGSSGTPNRGANQSLPSESVSSLHTLSRSAFPWMYLLYSLILRAQLRSGCLTVFFSLRRALANQLETCARRTDFVNNVNPNEAAQTRMSTQARPGPHLPGPASCVSPEPGGPSRSWWGRGCPGVCTASASAAGPCPAAPVSCDGL